MEGYFNFGFTNSVRKPSSWFNSQRNSESNYKIEVEWNCDAVDKDDSIEDVDTVDTDLDSDSFLSDLERDSGENKADQDQTKKRRTDVTQRLHYTENDWNEAVQKRNSDDCHDYHNDNNHSDSIHVSRNNHVSSVMNDDVLEHVNNNDEDNKISVDHLGDSVSCCYLSRLDFSCILGLLSLSVLIFSLIAPHWLVSSRAERSSFVRLNPWDLCVRDMTVMSRDGGNVTLHGCYNVWDPVLESGQGRLIQNWFLTVPVTLLIASSLSLSSRAFLFLIWFKKREIFPLKLGTKLMLVCAMFDLLSGLLLLTTTMTFAASVLTSSWLTPNTSSLSWGWASCLTSSWAHVAVAALMARETYKERMRRVQNENFIRNLRPSNSNVM